MLKSKLTVRTFMTLHPLSLDLSSFRFDSDKRNLLENGHFGSVAAFEDKAGN